MNLTKRAQLKSRGIDPPFLIIIGILLIFGLSVLYSASLNLGVKRFDDSSYYFKEQLINGLIVGVAGFVLALKMPFQFFKKYSFIFLILSVGLLISVFFSDFGVSFGGAKRWLQLGPLNFQPSEVVKLTFIIYMAAWLEARRKEVSGLTSAFIPFLIVTGIIGALLLMQPDMGTFGVIALSGLVMYWVAGGSGKHILAAILIGLVSFFALAWVAPYRWDRLTVFLDPSLDPSGKSYHINQALSSIGLGGIGGVGLGKARSSVYLPEAAGDSIFAVLAEEFGLLGVTVVLLLLLFLAVRGYQLARHAPDYFSQLVIVGIISWIIIQSFVNIAAISGSFILTGIPLPFFSHGGTALAITLTAAGIIANISRYRIS